MHLYNEFTDKFGFNDGGSVPNYAETILDLYIQVINAFAEQNESAFRAVKYLPGGSHNPLRLFYLPTSHLELEPDSEEYAELLSYDVDEAMTEAISAAEEEDLDDYLEIQFHIKDEELKTLLQEIIAKPKS